MKALISQRTTGSIWVLMTTASVALVGRTLTLVYDMARPMPYWDAWEFMKALPAILADRYTIQDLFAFHNEHRIVTTRLLMMADVQWFDASGYLPTAILAILLCCIGLLLAFVSVGSNWLGGAVGVLTMSLLLSIAQSDNYASGFQVQFPLADLSAIAAIGLFAISCVPGRSLLWVASAVVANAVAIISMASGNTVIAPVLLVGIALRAPLSRVAAFIVPALMMTAAYLIGYPKAELPPSHDPFGIAHFAVDYLGSALRGYPGASLWLGAVLLAAYFAILVFIARAWWRKDRLDVVMIWLAGVAAFTVMGALVTAVGRLNYGIEAAVSSRYAIQSLLFASCVFLMGWRCAAVFSSHGQAQLGLALGCMTLSASSTLAGAPLREWRDRVAAYDTAGDAFSSGVFADGFVIEIYPHPKLIRQTLAFMANRRLGPFSERYGATYRPPTNAAIGVDDKAMPACTSAQDSIQSIGPRWQEMVGWAFTTDAPTQSGWVLAFDTNRRLLGYARQSIARPDVSSAYHISVSQVGFRIALNIDSEGSVGRKPATLIVLPSGIDGVSCRVTVDPEPA